MNPITITPITRSVLLSLLSLLTACSLLVVLQPTNTEPLTTALPTRDLYSTVAVAVQQTLQVQAPLPTSTATQAQAATTGTTAPATATLMPANTPLLTATPTNLPSAATSAPVITGCQDAAQYISDDGLDGTIYTPNTLFTKIWTVKNTGSCT